MHQYKRLLAVALVVCLTPWPVTGAPKEAKSKSTYKTNGAPDVVQVRAVVAALGRGHHIMVRTTGRQEYHGNIQAIDADSFDVLPDRTTSPVHIAFAEVQQLGPNMSKGAKIGLIVGITVAAAVIILAIAVSKAKSELGL
jgi:hypothetical protein